METKSFNRVLTGMSLSGGLSFGYWNRTILAGYDTVYPLVLRSSLVFLTTESIWVVAVPK